MVRIEGTGLPDGKRMKEVNLDGYKYLHRFGREKDENRADLCLRSIVFFLKAAAVDVLSQLSKWR